MQRYILKEIPGAVFLRILFVHKTKSTQRKLDFSLPLERYRQTGPDVSCFEEIRLIMGPVWPFKVRNTKSRTIAPLQLVI